MSQIGSIHNQVCHALFDEPLCECARSLLFLILLRLTWRDDGEGMEVKGALGLSIGLAPTLPTLLCFSLNDGAIPSEFVIQFGIPLIFHLVFLYLIFYIKFFIILNFEIIIVVNVVFFLLCCEISVAVNTSSPWRQSSFYLNYFFNSHFFSAKQSDKISQCEWGFYSCLQRVL